MDIQLQSLVFAFTSGLFTIFSPCSYVLLPGYISYYLGSDFTMGRAISGGIVCTMGLITIFVAIGGLVASLGNLISQIIPLLDLIAGVLIIIMGIITLRQIQLPHIRVPVRLMQKQGLVGIYTFGMIYGMAGVGCSAPIFLSVIFYSMSQSLAIGILSFVLYAIGMGVPLIITTIFLAQAKELLILRIKNVTPKIQQISGIILILVGLYLFYFYYATYM